jgi:hypothetical protein
VIPSYKMLNKTDEGIDVKLLLACRESGKGSVELV